uniref:Metalloendopeptidase n=1 Tax=Parastrongyloides trichosuri TaxID=131310 RepID=A0A0N4Z3D3_PARTI
MKEIGEIELKKNNHTDYENKIDQIVTEEDDGEEYNNAIQYLNNSNLLANLTLAIEEKKQDKLKKSEIKIDPRITSHLLQGDIILTDDELRNLKSDLENDNSTNEKRTKRSIKISSQIEWKMPVNIYISNKSPYRNITRIAISLIQNNTCIRFNECEKTILWKQGINVLRSTKYCASLVGAQYINKPQTVRLALQCFTRIDRDEYVKIIENNIIPEEKFNFKKDPESVSSKFDHSYDYSSVMQYPPFAFGKNYTTTIYPYVEYYMDIMGQTHRFSFNDYNHGYQGPKCRSLQFTNESICGKANLTANSTDQYLTVRNKNCTFNITSSNNTFIYLYVVTSVSRNAKNPTKFLYCYEKDGLEIKYRSDKGATGLCLCGYQRNIRLVSEDNEVTVMWYGHWETHMFSLKYKEVTDRNYTEVIKSNNKQKRTSNKIKIS